MRETANGTPKSPALTQLKKSLDLLNDIVDGGLDLVIVDGETTLAVRETQIVDIIDALNWAYVFLLNRKDYHKKRTTQQKIEIELLKDQLKSRGIDVERLERRASSIAEDKMINETEDIEELS